MEKRCRMRVRTCRILDSTRSKEDRFVAMGLAQLSKGAFFSRHQPMERVDEKITMLSVQRAWRGSFFDVRPDTVGLSSQSDCKHGHDVKVSGSHSNFS